MSSSCEHSEQLPEACPDHDKTRGKCPNKHQLRPVEELSEKMGLFFFFFFKEYQQTLDIAPYPKFIHLTDEKKNKTKNPTKKTSKQNKTVLRPSQLQHTFTNRDPCIN